MKILFVSLGCDKNLVDSEMMLGMLQEKGFSFTDDETEADIDSLNEKLFAIIEERIGICMALAGEEGKELYERIRNGE